MYIIKRARISFYFFFPRPFPSFLSFSLCSRVENGTSASRDVHWKGISIVNIARSKPRYFRKIFLPRNTSQSCQRPSFQVERCSAINGDYGMTRTNKRARTTLLDNSKESSLAIFLVDNPFRCIPLTPFSCFAPMQYKLRTYNTAIELNSRNCRDYYQTQRFDKVFAYIVE